MKAPRPADPKRSALMARVRRKGTSSELVVSKELRALGVRYRKNVKALPGSPDFANRAKSWAVFVHGCFWHQHRGCSRATIPKSNQAFWCQKFAANKARDARSIRALRRIGFNVTVVWECEAVKPERLRRKLSQIF